MKFSAQEEYGIRCLLQIAKVGAEESMTISEISRAEGLSSTHVAKLLMILRKDGFIVSTRGQAGGYQLARPADQITIGAVLESLGGRLFDHEFCARHSGLNPLCAHAVDCEVKSLWAAIQAAVDTVVHRITLADLMNDAIPERNVSFSARRPIAATPAA
jgi:Rrf2 family protein